MSVKHSKRGKTCFTYYVAKTVTMLQKYATILNKKYYLTIAFPYI